MRYAVANTSYRSAIILALDVLSPLTASGLTGDSNSHDVRFLLPFLLSSPLWFKRILLSPTGTDPDRTNPQTFCFNSTMRPTAESRNILISFILRLEYFYVATDSFSPQPMHSFFKVQKHFSHCGGSGLDFARFLPRY